jgi:8-oxo-dGTP diphosphatase
LRREVQEEVGLDIEIGQPFYVGEWRPVVKGEQLQIIGIFFLCTTQSNDVTLSEDHDDYKWAGLEETKSLPVTDPIPEAIKVLVARGDFE